MELNTNYIFEQYKKQIDEFIQPKLKKAAELKLQLQSGLRINQGKNN